MKNIFVLATDKPSRLAKINSSGRLVLSYKPDNWSFEVLTVSKQNIYITSDEEIKEGDYIAYPVLKNWIPVKYLGGDLSGFEKKIILTTDQDLIKDGVQAIDDDFLEWFVDKAKDSGKAIDIVEVEKYHGINTSIAEVSSIGGNDDYNWQGKGDFRDYKIVIPKEEWISPMQEFKLKEESTIFKITEKQFQEEFNKEVGNALTKEEPKQETLEEASFRFYPEDEQWTDRHIFTFGAKWQAERMYNKEEVIELIQFLSIDKDFKDYTSVSKETATYFIEQFKKK